MDKLKDVDWGGMFKSVSNKVKQYTLNLSDLELKVEDATSNEVWGPHGTVMSDIAEAAFDFESYRQIMGVLARRLQEKDENWRMCYKALLLLEFLVKHGPMKVVHDISSSASVLDRLTYFDYKDANGKDHGVNVRHRAKELLQLVNNPDRVREERAKAKANKAKYVGVSASEMRMGGFGSGSSGRATGFSGGSAPSTQRMYAGGPGGGAGGSDGFSGRSSGTLGGGGSFGRTGRMSQDESEEDYHYISKRATASEGGEADPVAATRARIETLKLSSKGDAEMKAEGSEQHRKKLTDVKVNPKIAASLGLKLAAPAPAAPKPAPAAAAPAPGPAAVAAPASQMDLLGGLEAPAPAAPATDFFAAAPAPAAPAAAAALAGASWDAFGSPAPAAPAPAPAAAGAGAGWDAFGAGAAPAPAPAAAARAPAPLDLFGDLGAAPAAPAASAASVSPAAAAAPAFDPFAAGAVTGSGGGDPFAPRAAPAPATAAPPAPAATAAAGGSAKSLSRPLPEDMFSDLTGLSKPAPPMGSGRGLHMEPPPLAGAAAAAGRPPFPAAAPGAAPGGLPAMGPVVVDPRTGQPVMLVPVPLAPGQAVLPGMPAAAQQHAAPAMPDLSSLVGPPGGGAAQQGQSSAGGRDPFADLLG